MRKSARRRHTNYTNGHSNSRVGLPDDSRLSAELCIGIRVELRSTHLGQMLLQVLRGIEGSRKAKATHIESDGVSPTAGIDHRRRKRLRGNEFRTTSLALGCVHYTATTWEEQAGAGACRRDLNVNSARKPCVIDISNNQIIK